MNEYSYIKNGTEHSTTLAKSKKEAKKPKENIYLNRLKEQYKQMLSKKQGYFYLEGYNRLLQDYLAMRLFCLDTQLISFNDIEVMENEINSSF
jgi:hypothetical protein